MTAKRKLKDGKASDRQTSEVLKTSEVSVIPAPYELPDGWTWTTVAKLYQIVGGGTPSTSVEEYWNGAIPWITGADIHGLKDIRPRKQITEKAIRESATNLVPQGSIIVVTRVGLGKIALTRTPLCFSQDSHALIGDISIVDPDYALYYLSRAVQIFRTENRGTTIVGVTKRQLSDLTFPLPPLPEQRRIVAKIEQLFAESRTARDALERVSPLLKRFRQSVLAAAFRGQLTERDPNDEPASALLARIQRLPKSSRLRKSETREDTPAPPPPDTSALPELPEGWVWANVEQACAQIVDCPHSTPKFKESGFLCVDTNSIEPGRIVLERVRHVDESTFKNRIRRMKPRESDVIFSREGGLLGIAVLVPPNLEFCLGQRLMIFRLGEIINAKYFEIVLNSQFFRDQYTPRIGGTASPHLNIKDIRKLGIPLPPLAEQRRIVARIEALFAQADAVERAVVIARQRADKIDQAILSRAFRGEL